MIFQFRFRKPLSLEIVGILLSKNFYTRLDRLQEDVFAILDEIRSISRTDSEVSVTMCVCFASLSNCFCIRVAALNLMSLLDMLFILCYVE